MLNKQFDQIQNVVEVQANYNQYSSKDDNHVGTYEYLVELKDPVIRQQFYEVVNGLSNGALVYQLDIDLSHIDTDHIATISQSALDTWLSSVKKIVKDQPSQYQSTTLQQFKIGYQQVRAISQIAKLQTRYLHCKYDVKSIWQAAAKLCCGFTYTGLIWMIAMNFSNWMSQGLFSSFIHGNLLMTLIAAIILIGIAWDILQVIPKMIKILVVWLYLDDDHIQRMLKQYHHWKATRNVPKSFSLEDGQIKSNAAKKE